VNFFYVFSDLKNIPRSLERLPPLGIMGAQLRALLDFLSTTDAVVFEGLKGALN